MGFLGCLGSIESAVVPTIGGLLGGGGTSGGAAPVPGAEVEAQGESPYLDYLRQRGGAPAGDSGVPLGQLLGEAGLGQSIDGVPGNLIGTFF